jgi:hypothetical protein
LIKPSGKKVEQTGHCPESATASPKSPFYKPVKAHKKSTKKPHLQKKSFVQGKKSKQKKTKDKKTQITKKASKKIYSENKKKQKNKKKGVCETFL